MHTSDTIAAIITAPGRAAVGIIRLSGGDALSLAEKCYQGKKKLSDVPSHSIVYGWVGDPNTGKRIDEALFLIMRAPKSYTGEDVVEIQCHGGMEAVREILTLCLRLGARLAEEGEFTKRAFINGKLDLTRAEAIMDIVDAKSEAALHQAISQKSGALAEHIHDLRESLLELIAFIQADLDYPEDDIERLSDKEYESRAKALEEVISALITSGNRGKIIREGIKLAILGKPNVGKSSLLNALLGRERAIVTDTPGTTRDVVTEYLTLAGVPVQILDTAGIRETDDAIEAIGVARAKEAAQEADLILYVIDAQKGIDEDDLAFLREAEKKPSVLVCNKMDLKSQCEVPKPYETKRVFLSAKSGAGLNDLEEAVCAVIFSDESVGRGNEAACSNARHLALLAQAEADLDNFLKGLAQGMSKDMLVIDLQNAWESLGLITGETASEDLIDTIFAKFCLGK